MPASILDASPASLMGSLGMTLVDGAWKWNKDPSTSGSAGSLPLPLPKAVEDLLKNKTAEAVAEKIAVAAKERQEKQGALDRGIEPAGPFSPTYEEAGLLPPIGIPVGGLDENPATRLAFPFADWQHGLWPGLEQIIARNLRVSSFTATWGSVLPLFQAQYAEYLVNPSVKVAGPVASPVETTALLISPRSVSGRVPALDAADLAYTGAELDLASELPDRFLEYHLEAAAGLLDKARQFQVERENKAALAASFALDIVQFLVEDQRQRTDIASGATVAPIIAAMGDWSSAERDANAMKNQAKLLESIAVSLQASPSDSATAAARMAYATAWTQTVFYGPDVATLSSGTRVRADEIKEAAQAAAQVSSAQQALLLRGQGSELAARAVGSEKKAAAERERAAAAAHGANRSILRVNDLARITTSKLLMACTPGGPLNYAQHEQRIRLEYLATLRAGLLRLAAAAKGVYSLLGYGVKMPGVVVRVLPSGSIPPSMVEPSQVDADARPSEVLLSASLWLRDAATWFLARMRVERRWVRVVALRSLVATDAAWSAAIAIGEVQVNLDEEVLGARVAPRLRGVAIEVVPSSVAIPTEPAGGYYMARLSFPKTPGPIPAVQLNDREIGRVRRVNASLPPLAPELTDCILNVSPLGHWGIKFDPGSMLDDIYLHLWLAET